MREIKFRFWIDNIMIYKTLEEILLGEFSSLEPKQERVMQFTGLRDKNGREIYEGDIVEVTDPYTEVREWTDVVKWQHDGYYLDVVINADYPKVEVIGNIYENPELVK